MLRSIYVGYDRREHEMYRCCVKSLYRNMPIESQIPVYPLVQDHLRACGIYKRPMNEPGSTDFSNSRWLTPYMAGEKGWSLFMDCDILNTYNINKLFDAANGRYAVMVVKHDYIPKRTVKMAGQEQKPLIKKNWSSVMLFNNAHPSTKTLTPDFINNADAGSLHRFEWCKEDEVGELDVRWNWLEGEYDKSEKTPFNIHFTNGHFLLQNDTSGTHDYEDLLRKEYELINAK